jgi:putative transcriptional regulator
MISSVIKVKLQELLEEKKKSLYRLQKETDIAYTTLLHLNNGEVKGITFDVLEKICDNLECTPNDLLAIEK